MPGKVNPVVCEAVRQVAAQVFGNDAAVAFAGSQGDFELNVMLPVIGAICSSRSGCWRTSPGCSPTGASTVWSPTRRCFAGYAEGSPSIVTALNRYVGYEEAAAIAKQALKTGATIRAW